MMHAPPAPLVFRRRYHFAAAHRLHCEALSAEENEALYDMCNRENGHGHNYEFDLFVSGGVNPKTQMMLDLSALDTCVETQLLELVDHRFLDREVALFENEVSTVENIARLFFEHLLMRLPVGLTLHGVRVYESRNNAAEYFPHRNDLRIPFLP